MKTKQNWHKNIYTFIRSAWLELLTIIPLVILSLDQHKPNPIYGGLHPVWTGILTKCVIPALILICFIQILNAWEKYQTAKLKSEKAKLENDLDGYKEAHQKILHEHLSLISKKCSFGKTERISIYKYTPNGFQLIGRYSETFNFETRGRGSLYPLETGIIAKAWNEGSVKISDLPDATQNEDDWVENLYQQYKTPKEILKTLNMKSRNYFAFRINKHDSRLGVSVIESTRPRKISSSNIEHFKEHHVPQIVSILDNLNMDTVNLEYARNEGF